MSRLNVFCVNLQSGSLIVTDKLKGHMSIYRAGAKKPIFKVSSAFDIIALRDLLNDAYPPEEIRYDRVR